MALSMRRSKATMDVLVVLLVLAGAAEPLLATQVHASAPGSAQPETALPDSSPGLHQHGLHQGSSGSSIQHEDADGHGFACGHSLMSEIQDRAIHDFENDMKRDSPPELARHLLQTSIPPQMVRPATIRIKVDYRIDNLNSAQQEQVKRVMGTAVRVLQKFLRVKYPLSSNLLFRPSVKECVTIKSIPARLVAGMGPGEPNTDLYLFVTADVKAAACSSGTTLAWTTACDFDIATRRPIMGVVNMCNALFDVGNTASSSSSSGSGGGGGYGSSNSGSSSSSSGDGSGRPSSPGYVGYRAMAKNSTAGVEPEIISDSVAEDGYGIRRGDGIENYSDTILEVSKINYSLDGRILDTVTHEIMHLLGFNAKLFSTYLDSRTGRPYNYQVLTYYDYGAGPVPYLSTPAVTREAQKLLGCSRLPGAPLENQGGSGNALHHWEFRFFYQDLMTPWFFSTQRARISSLTLALLEDTGWYIPRYQYAQMLSVLSVTNPNCELAFSSCERYSAKYPGQYYCYNGVGRTCLTPYTSTTCASSPFSDSCQMLKPTCKCTDKETISSMFQSSRDLSYSSGYYLGHGAYFNDDSRCLTYTMDGEERGGCFQAACSRQSDGSWMLRASVDDLLQVSTFQCPAGSSVDLGQFIPVGDVGLQCPAAGANLDYMCATLVNGTSCINGLMGPDGTCRCDLEWVGNDCSTHISSVPTFDVPQYNPPGPSPSPSSVAANPPRTPPGRWPRPKVRGSRRMAQ